MLKYRIWLLTSMFLALLVVRGFSQQEKLDTRRWSISYWQKMAHKGLVELNKDIKVPPAEYTGNEITMSYGRTVASADIPIISSSTTTQSENSVFVNPLNANKVLNSNNSTDWPVNTFYGADYWMSADGGNSWTGSVQGAGGSNNGDPAVAIDLNNRYYVGYVAANNGQGVAYSTNEGSSWTHVQIANAAFMGLLDKNHLWVDNSSTSAYSGNLYSAWTDFGGSNDGDIVISRSTNGGLSWDAGTNISSAISAGSHNQGVNIQTGPDGEVYAVWAVYDSWPADENALGFAKSTDGGASWNSATRIISNIRGIRITETSKNHRVNSFPVMAVDISGGPRNGWIYVVWTNIGYPGINTGPDIDIYMIRSTDSGTTWSPPIRINQDPPGLGKEHYFPWITCDPVTGRLSVIFYDDRNVASTQCEVFVATSYDGGTTWDDFKVSDVSFTPSPIPGLAAGYFGDYLGISSRNNKVYPVWTDNRTGNALAYVSPFEFPGLELTVDQKLSDGTSIDSVGHWEGGPDFVPYAVPHTFSFDIGATEALRGAQKIISNQKYHNWSIDDTVTNHREFHITSSFPDQLVSEFDETHPGITIRTKLISAPGEDGGTIDFKDPWFIDYPDPQYGDNLRNRGMDTSGPDALRFWTRTSPFHPDYETLFGPYKYRGVFLNQDYNIPGQPYYSVRAPQEQVIPFHGQDITWYFRSWSGSDVAFKHFYNNQTAVVFQQPGAVARARYKGHLASASNKATAYNNARHVVHDPVHPTTWYATYQDNNQIYFTQSADDGETWSPEVHLIAESIGPNRNPSIDAQYLFPAERSLQYIVVVWDQEYYSNYQMLHRPVLMYQEDSNWQPSKKWSTGQNASANSVPVVTATLYHLSGFPENQMRFYVLCKTAEGIALLRFLPENDYFELVENPLPGTGPSSQSPAITSSTNLADDNFLYYCWEDSGRIHYSYYNVQEESGPPEPVWTSPPGWGGSDANPSITYHAYEGSTYVDIVWQHFDGETGWRFRHQRMDAMNPARNQSPVHEVSQWPPNYTRPSVGALENSQQLFATTLDGNREFRSLFYDGIEWTLERQFEGTHAGLNEIGGESMVVWTDHTAGVPNLIGQQILTPPATKNLQRWPARNRSPAPLTETTYREQIIDLSQLAGLHLKGTASHRKTLGGQSLHR